MLLLLQQKLQQRHWGASQDDQTNLVKFVDLIDNGLFMVLLGSEDILNNALECFVFFPESLLGFIPAELLILILEMFGILGRECLRLMRGGSAVMSFPLEASLNTSFQIQVKPKSSNSTSTLK